MTLDEESNFLELLISKNLMYRDNLNICNSPYFITLGPNDKFIFFVEPFVFKDLKLEEVFENLPLRFQEVAIFNMDLFV